MNPDETKSLITKALLMLFTALSTSLHLSESAGTWATMSSDIADVLVLTYGVYQHRGMKKVPEAARVVGGMLLVALLCGLGSPSYATDIAPVKAPPKQPVCTVTTCTGLFVGGFVANAGGNIDVIGAGLTGLAQNGLGFGGQGGYEFFANNIYAAFYVDIQDDLNLNAPPGTSFSSRLTYGVGGRLGYSLASSFGAATTGTTAPTLPQQFLASLMTPYINVWEGKRHGQLALRSGAGIEALLSTNVTLNADYFHYSYNQGGTAGSLAGLPVKLTDDNEFRLSINRHFGF